jgi:CBS domain-containing protein
VDIDLVYRRDVFSISSTDSLAEAARRMRAHDVSSLVVLDDERFVGVITERDLTRAIAAGDSPETAFVATYMADGPITIGPQTGVREAAAEMLETEVRHLPVGEGDRVMGMISLRDLLTVVAENPSL